MCTQSDPHTELNYIVAQCFAVFSSFSCDRLALVKVKVSVFIVAVVGSLTAAYEIRICVGCT